MYIHKHVGKLTLVLTFGPFTQKAQELIAWNRALEEVSLAGMATDLLERQQLAHVLDTFRDCRKMQVPRHRYDRAAE